MARKNSPNHGALKQGRNGRWYYNVTLPGTKKRSSKALRPPGHTHSTKEKRLAIILANEMWDDYAARAEESGDQECLLSEMTLKEYMDKYVEMRKHDLSASTMEGYQISMRYAMDFFGKKQLLNMITPYQVQEFKTALMSGTLNRVSANIHMKQLRAVLYFAVNKLKILSVNPFAGMVDVVKQSKRWHYITQDELQSTLEAATPNYRCMIALCRLAALRRLEAFNLKWQDINFDKGTIYVVGDADWQPKNRQSRTVPMCPELLNMLLEEFEQASIQRTRVCLLKYAGNIGRDMNATIKRAGLTPWEKPLHDLRKSCITDWASRYPIHAVKEWAGHKDIATTQEYYTQILPVTYEQATTSSFWSNKSISLQSSKI